MGLFYTVPLQATPATKNHQADYPTATYWPYIDGQFQAASLFSRVGGGGNNQT